MNSSVHVPPRAVPYILLQRTETQKWLKEMRYALPQGRTIHNLIYNTFLYRMEAAVRRDEIQDEYLSQLRDEFEEIREYLPGEVDSILDIGCGVGGINVFLKDHYGSEDLDFYLFDKTEVSSYVYYQFNQEAAYYNSLEVAREMMETNGVPRERVHTLNADETDPSELEDVDLCVSFLSWAFHYPAETYLEEVVECLAPAGTLILDFRRGTGGFERCRERFRDHRIIDDNDEYRRVALEEPIKQARPRAAGTV